MSAHYASCDFPFLKKWKELGDVNPAVGYVDSVLSGFGQITFNDSPFCGAIFVIAVFVASPIQGISGVWSACVATALAYLLGVPKGQIRHGLYTINACLAGLSIPLIVFKNDFALTQILVYSTIGSVFTVLFTGALRRIFMTWEVSPLASPFCLTIFIVSSASYLMTNLKATPLFTPAVVVLQQGREVVWTFSGFLTALLNGLAQVIWVEEVPLSSVAGVIFLIGVLTASRIDALVAVVCGTVGTVTAMLLGIGQGGIMLGLYGYNAVLLSQVLFGRAYKMSVGSFVMVLLLSMLSVVLCVGLKPLLGAVGVPVAAFPFVTISICAMLGRKYYSKLEYITPPNWTVPEFSSQYVEEKTNA